VVYAPGRSPVNAQSRRGRDFRGFAAVEDCVNAASLAHDAAGS
jgi:hypothetical protein